MGPARSSEGAALRGRVYPSHTALGHPSQCTQHVVCLLCIPLHEPAAGAYPSLQLSSLVAALHRRNHHGENKVATVELRLPNLINLPDLPRLAFGALQFVLHESRHLCLTGHALMRPRLLRAETRRIVLRARVPRGHLNTEIAALTTLAAAFATAVPAVLTSLPMIRIAPPNVSVRAPPYSPLALVSDAE